MTFAVFGIAAPPQLIVRQRSSALVAACCRSCGLPVVVQLRSKDRRNSPNDLDGWLTQMVRNGHDLEIGPLERVGEWPLGAAAAIPDDLPDDVERAFRQAEANFAATECEEAAAMMYRRSLELALKIAFPDLKGSLAARIRTLVDDHHLPRTIGDWLTQVRLIGNDGAHDIDGVSRPDLEDARGFVDMALRYIFTLPSQVAARRGLMDDGE